MTSKAEGGASIWITRSVAKLFGDLLKVLVWLALVANQKQLVSIETGSRMMVVTSCYDAVP